MQRGERTSLRAIAYSLRACAMARASASHSRDSTSTASFFAWSRFVCLSNLERMALMRDSAVSRLSAASRSERGGEESIAW